MTLANGTCSVDGCEKPIKHSGLCSMHAERKRRTGDPGEARPRRRPHGAAPEPCRLDGCSKPAIGYSHGLCQMHAWRVRNYGDPHHEQPKQRIRKDGYRAIWKPDHPLAYSDGYVLEHRMVVHDAGIEVPDGHHVHHVNGDKLDNRLENLVVLDGADHTRRHLAEQGYVVNQYGVWPIKPRAA